ncbi:UDP-N-acetylmuramate dehydrogenase [Gracilimonas amylolytica]|uniref:UDP-N-acetylmuramate dehydrogenase n=1 Tax=Gracilimonas amylolytica TaxID=1749045 RepID=UPI000CD7E9B7|nr:UDP-N-acetylmuramate dehydrogenase [Gracilimonas amylolytica]
MTDTPEVKEHFDLKEHNTIGVSAKARYFASVSTADELRQLLLDPKYKLLPKLMLGGGSNILFANDFEGLVIHLKIKGREVVEETGDHVHWKLGSGENWHQVVLGAIENDWAGIENLSLIPGSVGAAPIQNIGAYGVELEQVFHSLEALDLNTGIIKTFEHKECKFGYRDSAFKNDLKGKYVITSVTLKLSKHPKVNTSYRALSDHLNEQGIEEPTIRQVSNAVIEIRQSKLPDPKEIGNTGSFFKNPVISEEEFGRLKNKHPDVPNYPDKKGVKVPAAWLIDQCGWKGERIGDAGVHKKQALVLVNYGSATGAEIIELAEKIRRSVHNKFGVVLTPEVNIV